jgi:hypothetical protein
MSVLAPEESKHSWLIEAATTIVRPFIGDTRRPAQPLVHAEQEWQVLHDPAHEPVRMDSHCPSCGTWSCGWCSYCFDDYFVCCWNTCPSCFYCGPP